MLQFNNALLGHRIVSQRMTEALLIPRVALNPEVNPDLNYGYGFFVENVNGLRSIGHGGMGPGTNFVYRSFPELGTAMILISNQDGPGYDDLQRNLLTLLTRK